MRLIKPDHKNHPLGRDIVTNNYARLGSILFEILNFGQLCLSKKFTKVKILKKFQGLNLIAYIHMLILKI